MNVILPIFDKLAPGGVPPSGIQWEEIMLRTKIAYFNIWKKGKKRYELMGELNAKWTSLEYDVFEYLGPRGKDLASLKKGAMDDDDADLDTSRESAKKGVRAAKKMKFDTKESDVIDAKTKTQNEIAAQLESHSKMASMRLVIQYGSAKQKEKFLAEIMKNVMPPSETNA